MQLSATAKGSQFLKIPKKDSGVGKPDKVGKAVHLFVTKRHFPPLLYQHGFPSVQIGQPMGTRKQHCAALTIAGTPADQLLQHRVGMRCSHLTGDTQKHGNAR